MNSSNNSPKEPSKVIGWSLISLGVIISVVGGIFIFLIGNELGGAIGGGIQGGGTLFFVVLIPYKIVTYGRRRMAERAENLIDLD